MIEFLLGAAWIAFILMVGGVVLSLALWLGVVVVIAFISGVYWLWERL